MKLPTHRLFDPVDIASLAFFRIALGVVLIVHTAPFVQPDSDYMVAAMPSVHLPYLGLEWIVPATQDVMRVLLWTMLVASVGITLGLAYRVSVILYALIAAYCHFMDAAKFVNHYYLVILFTFLLAFMPANGAASVDAWLFPGLRRATTPRWTIWLLRFQVGIPFLFSGLSKLNADWLAGFPSIFFWLSFAHAHPWAQSIDPSAMALFIAWGGVVTDLALFPLLVLPRTRILGFLWALAFNLGNMALFTGPLVGIEMFAWIMLAAVTIFLDPAWPRRLWDRISRRTGVPRIEPASSSSSSVLTPARRSGLALMGLWILVQLLVPLRYHFYPGNSSWTAFGQTHAWHMMFGYVIGQTRFTVTDPATGESWTRDPTGAVIGERLGKLERSPALIYQYALHIKRQMEQQGRPGCEVRADSFASLNGRPMQRLIDPEIDITREPPRWGYYPWVLPLRESRPPLDQVRLIPPEQARRVRSDL